MTSMVPPKPSPGTRDRLPSLDLLDPELYATGDPHSIWRSLRHYSPICWHEPSHGMPGFWVLTRYRDIAWVLQNPEIFGSADGILLRPMVHGKDPGGGSTLALTDPPRHQLIRALVRDWFTERNVRSLKSEMLKIAVEVIDRVVDLQACDFVEDVAAVLPLYVICHLMGVPDTDRQYVLSLTSKAFGSGEPSARRLAHVQLMEYLSRLVDLRRRDPGDDVVSRLCLGEIEGSPLTERDIVLTCDNLLVGGTENVRITIAGGMLQFLERPAEWRRLRQDPSLLPTAVEEILRWTSTPTHILRTTRASVTILDRRVEEGMRVTVWLPSANRDEAVFPDPDVFDIGRTPNRHLSFGHGEHFCIGSALARAELRILYAELAARTSSIESVGDPTFIRSIIVNGPQVLPVHIKGK